MSDGKKNICFVLGSINSYGGTARSVSLLLNELGKEPFYQLSVVCYYNERVVNNYQLDKSIPVEYILPQRMNMRKGFLRTLGFLISYLRKNQIDTIVACGVLFFPAAIVAARIAGCRIICWDHSNFTCVYDAKYERQSRIFAALFSDVLITLTKKDLENYKRSTKVRTTIDYIHNIIDPSILNKKFEKKQNTKKIISVGRLTYAKNYELLVEIASQVLRKHEDWAWDIYGEGELHQKIQSKIDELNVERLSLKGFCQDIYDRYFEYEFIVMTSRYEGFPMVLLEALACGVPVIAFDCHTGPSDIIETNINGILVKNNDKDSMLNEIELLIENVYKLKTMSQNCKPSLERFQTKSIINKWKRYLL